MKSISAALAVATFAGCASFSTFKTARALDPGQTQVTFSGSAIVDTVPYHDGSGRQYTEGAPQFELGVRYGIADGFDLGAKIWSLGGEINSTISLVRSRYFDLALAPSVGVVNYSYDTDCDSFGDNCGNNVSVLELFAKIPLLFGVRFGPQQEHELVFGPEAVPITVLTGDDNGNSSSSSGLLLGGVLGVSIKTTPWLRIMPEITVLTPVVHYYDQLDSGDIYTGNGLINGYGRSGSILYQAGLGFSWGGDGFEHPRYAGPPRREYRDREYRDYAPPPPQYAPPPPGYAPPPPPRSDD